VGLVLTVAASIGVGASACDDAFEPFKTDSELHFSVFGYMDASADTQWIRVTPIRESVFTTPGALDATVTLEQMGSGATIVLRDSVFVFDISGPEGQAQSDVHNFWTDEPIEPDATYRLTVTASNGATTTAMVPIPKALPEATAVERVISLGGGRGRGGNPTLGYQHLVRVEAESLVMVRVIHELSDRVPVGSRGAFVDCSLPPAAPRIYSIRQPLQQASSNGGFQELPVARTLNPALLGSCVIGKQEALVAAATTAWPTGVDFSPSAPLTGDVPSTIEGGVGFVGGVVTRRFPLETCRPVPQELGTFCEMRYGPESVTVRGVVTDPTCNLLVEGAAIELREIHGPGSPTVSRTTRTDRLGRFELGALLAGIEYSLLITHPALWPPEDPYTVVKVYPDYTDTLGFTPGETVVYDVPLVRPVPCG